MRFGGWLVWTTEGINNSSCDRDEQKWKVAFGSLRQTKLSLYVLTRVTVSLLEHSLTSEQYS